MHTLLRSVLPRNRPVLPCFAVHCVILARLLTQHLVAFFCWTLLYFSQTQRILPYISVFCSALLYFPTVLQVIVREPEPAPSNGSAIAFACLVFWCCCWPLGLAAFIVASKCSLHSSSQVSARYICHRSSCYIHGRR